MTGYDISDAIPGWPCGEGGGGGGDGAFVDPVILDPVQWAMLNYSVDFSPDWAAGPDVNNPMVGATLTREINSSFLDDYALSPTDKPLVEGKFVGGFVASGVPSLGDRVVVSNVYVDGYGSYGIYTITDLGATGASPWVLTAAADWSTSADTLNKSAVVQLEESLQYFHTAPYEMDQAADGYVSWAPINSAYGPSWGYASVAASSGVAMGTYSRAVGNGAVAIGSQSDAEFDNSVAIGPNAVTTADYEIALGSNQSNVKIVGMLDTVQIKYPPDIVAATGASHFIDMNIATHDLTMDQACTFTFVNTAAAGELKVVLFKLTGAFVPSFVDAEYGDGAAPAYTTPSWFTATSLDNGTKVLIAQVAKAVA